MAYDKSIPMPPAPSDVYGSEFVGWYTAKDKGGEQISTADGMDYIKSVVNYENYQLDSLPSGRLVLYAGFKLIVYEVKFYSADGRELITTKNIQHGTAVTELDEITYNGKTVLEWGRTVNGTLVTGEITNEISLYAIKYGINIKFDSDGGNAVSLGIVAVGNTVTLPAPERQYARFICWTENGEPVDNDYTVPDRAVTLTAKWEITHYEVKYVSEGGEINSEMVEVGAAVSLPLLTKTNYKFNGWSYNGSLMEDGMAMPEKDITLTAQWERTHYSITYNTNGGEDPVSVVVAKGTSLTLPTPSNAYYIFDGWEYNGKKVDSSFVIPENDMTFYARWEKEFKDYKYISTAQDFVDIKNDVNGKYMLIADLDLSKVERDPLVTFGGEFKGNNHTIELGNREHTVSLITANNIYYNAANECIVYGWFAAANTGTISDFTVKNLRCGTKDSNGTGGARIGGICGDNSGTISNVNVVNSTAGNASLTEAQIILTLNNARCGGICGSSIGGTVTGCSVEALIFGEGITGGITGWMGTTTIDDCKFKGKIGMYLGLENGKAANRAWGGIVGCIDGNSQVADCFVDSCSFEYYGENEAYHSNGHEHCQIYPTVGIICGAVFDKGSSQNFSGNTYSNCSKELVLKGGNNHYGAYEKQYLFKYYDGMVGRIV